MNTQYGKEKFDKKTAKYFYVIVRDDIPRGMQGAQALHAAYLAGSKYGADSSTRICFLTAPKTELEILKDKLEFQNIDHCFFEEPDYGIGFSAIATGPISAKDARIFKKHPLWT